MAGYGKNAKGGEGKGGLLKGGYWAAQVTATPTPQPTVTHSRAAVFKIAINGVLTDISSYLHSLALNRSAQPIKTSGLTSPAHQYVPGQVNTTLPFAGFFDPTMQQSLEAIKASGSATFEYYPGGTATGQSKFSGTATIDSHNTASDVTDANRFEGELTMSGSPLRTTL